MPKREIFRSLHNSDEGESGEEPHEKLETKRHPSSSPLEGEVGLFI